MCEGKMRLKATPSFDPQFGSVLLFVLFPQSVATLCSASCRIGTFSTEVSLRESTRYLKKKPLLTPGVENPRSG